MARPVTALVTGFTKNGELPGLSFAPLRTLRQKGVIKRIVALTWDKPEIDAFVAPVAAMDDVTLIRIPEPQVAGGRYQNGVVYQIRSLEAALGHVPESDALVVKLRPDFVADTAFLEDKIVNFERYCAPSKLAKRFGVKMPAMPFAMKIWIPWADANQPFFYDDAAFIGLKRDIALLASREAESHLAVLADKDYGWFAHVVRFALPFLRNYPIFEKYLRNFHYFPNNLDHRLALLPELVSDPFYWHLLVAHAWVLANAFHVDCGNEGQLKFFANISNPDADWSSLKSLTLTSPYNDIAMWRAGQVPGGMMPATTRAYGRLMDDSWQHSLFTTPALRDLTPENLRAILLRVAIYRKGLLGEDESRFYRLLAAILQKHTQLRAA